MIMACEDGPQISTHKMVLASSSPFFMEMLKRNKHPHPLIYMRGLKAEDLVDMVDFVNYGKANVDQERLDVFLGLAEEFGLRGLTSLSTESEPEEFRNKTTPPEKNVIEGKHLVKTTPILTKPLNLSDSNIAKTESSSAALVSMEVEEQLDEKIKSMMTKTEKISNILFCELPDNLQKNVPIGQFVKTCDVSGKTFYNNSCIV